MRIFAKIAARTALCILAAMTLSAPPAAAKPEAGKTFGNWIINCERPEGANEDKCYVSQTLTAGEQGGRLLHVSVGHLGPKGEVMGIIMLPLGIYLPTGAAFKIDEGRQVPVEIQNCTAEGCRAHVRIDAEQLKALTTGKALNVGFMSGPGSKTMIVPVPLNGFKAAIESLK